MDTPPLNYIELMPRHKRQKRTNIPKKPVLRRRSQVILQGETPFTTALQELRSNQETEIYGPRDDQCIRVKSKDFKKAKVEFTNARPKYYRPYKIAWLAAKRRWPGQNLECSHLCGSKECFNASHLVEETNADNHARRKCHNKLRKWAAERIQCVNLKVTFDTFGKRSCGCARKECFIMLWNWLQYVDF